MTLTSGAKLGPYEIESPLGAGGMGEVYRARDTRLDRVVAVKVLPSHLCLDAERKQRFEREARAISSLNHPYICTLYDVGSQDGIEFLVMEYLEGETLASRLIRGALPMDRALMHGIEISDALDTAHRRTIIHRDLKPANIFLTTHGEAKVLDFGLAKMADEVASQMPTVTSPGTLTSPGTTVGTVAYMSPEQARGEDLDLRTDIFSFGAVLYETITGKMAFPGKTSALVFKAILDETPPAITRLDPLLPARLDEIVSKALEKDRDLRYQSAADLRTDLKRFKRDSESGRIAAQPLRRRQKIAPKQKRILYAIAGTLLLITLAGLTMWILRQGTSHRQFPAMMITPFTTYQGDVEAPRVSPDASQIAFLWDRDEGKGFDVYVKLIGEATPLRLTNAPTAIAGLAWSPDGHRLAVLRPEQGGVFSISALGGPERRLVALRFPASAHSGLDWSPDGKWLAVTDKDRGKERMGIFVISPDTGERRRLTNPVSPFTDYLPVFSPDGSHVAFVRERGGLSGEVFGVPVRGGEPKKLVSLDGAIGGLDWNSDGKQIVVAALTQEDARVSLWRVDLATGKRERVNQFGSGDSGSPTVARRGGVLAYVHGVDNSNIWQLRLGGPTQPIGPARRLISSTRSESGAQYSPDGKRIAFVSDRTGSAQIWTCSADASNPAQLTFLKANDVGTPRWSPDGSRIVFDSSASGLEGVYLIGADGGAPEPLVVDSSANSEPSFSHDGQWIYFYSDRSGGDEVWKVPVAGGQPSKVTSHGGRMPVESPDGKFLYHIKVRSSETNSSEVGLWRMAVTGSDAVQILSQSLYSSNLGPDFFWTVSNAGISFLDDSNPSPKLKLFDPSTGRTATVAALKKPPFCCNPTLAVSPDGHALLYSQHDTFTRDIMLVEHFQ
jgi:Tol biopolymer transport system component